MYYVKNKQKNKQTKIETNLGIKNKSLRNLEKMKYTFTWSWYDLPSIRRMGFHHIEPFQSLLSLVNAGPLVTRLQDTNFVIIPLTVTV